jgi:DNA polymerase V
LVFVRTSPFRANDAQYSRSHVLPLRLPASDSLSITGAALQALERLYKPGYRYAKAGVMLLGLRSHTVKQAELDLGDDATTQAQKQDRLMRAMDAVNDRFGKGTLTVASNGVYRANESPSPWQMKQNRRSPRYTTRWNELMVIM